MNRIAQIVPFMIILGIPILAMAAEQMAHPAHAYFVNLKDGESVSDPVHIVFGLDGMKVAPAGTMAPNTGHFHLLIDTKLSEKQMKGPIPKDARHIHFGKGQTETTIDLAPGKHTLQLVMGDGEHFLHKPPVMSDIITVNVE